MRVCSECRLRQEGAWGVPKARDPSQSAQHNPPTLFGNIALSTLAASDHGHDHNRDHEKRVAAGLEA